MEPAIIKPDGKEQRIDVELTAAIAKSLGDLVLAGKPLYPKGKGKKLKLGLEENGELVSFELAPGSLNNWITRDNVIPGTGETLRSYLDGKRQEKRLADEQTRQSLIREGAEKQLAAIAGFKVAPVQITKSYRYNRETGERILTGEEHVENSPKLIEAVAKVGMFGLERLMPERYGAKVENTHNHFIFDLARLREARRARDAQQIEALPNAT